MGAARSTATALFDGDERAAVLRRLGEGTGALVRPASFVGTPSSSPEPGAHSVLPVQDPLSSLFPHAGLRGGTVVAVRDSTALLLSLLAAATAEGAWAAVVGMPDLGVLAASEMGVAVQRLALVPHPGNDLAGVLAALFDGMAVIALAGGERLPAGARRSLVARARQRGSVLLSVDRWPGADTELTCRTEAWHGLERGHGRLRCREVTVRAVGRGAAARPRVARLLLPGPDGTVAAIPPTVSANPTPVLKAR